MLKQDENILPVTLVDGEVVKTKAHLTNEEFENYTGFKVGQNAGAQAEQPQSGGCCCSSDSDCCK